MSNFIKLSKFFEDFHHDPPPRVFWPKIDFFPGLDTFFLLNFQDFKRKI